MPEKAPQEDLKMVHMNENRGKRSAKCIIEMSTRAQQRMVKKRYDSWCVRDMASFVNLQIGENTLWFMMFLMKSMVRENSDQQKVATPPQPQSENGNH